MRREWIEIILYAVNLLPLHSLPPCGGSGLKFKKVVSGDPVNVVSLHAEGVD